jgi:molecular chaperone DnaK (HSP70)
LIVTPRFSIGIDLGTTNSAIASVSLEDKSASTMVVEVPQWETLSSAVSFPTLPSFLYRPVDEELASLGRGAAAESGPPWVVGNFARAQAGRLPGRVIHSAKSWLACHGMDRTVPFLPWGSSDLAPEQKLSPIGASALILAHLRDAWDRLHPEAPFARQRITVTVPASFDALAQRLTLEAAAQAGFPAGIGLLEEPQAAFYRWLEAHETAGSLETQMENLRERTHHVLVIDVGGGTTDFSLFAIRLGKNRRLPEIQRVAVSDHLLLGGDNIDLALAHRVEPRLGVPDSLSADQWGHLVSQCRQAKELVLSSPDPGPCEISIPSRGSRLFGGILRATLEAGEVRALLLDGFYPECAATDRPESSATALREMGLPYAADSAVTRHLAAFLEGQPAVDAILCNGGSLAPAMVRERLRAQVCAWQGGGEVVLLDNPELSLAVARGAARFGQLLHQNARRIQAGAARSIYVEAAAGGKGKVLVCLLPKGTPPETETVVDAPGLKVRVQRPVQFRVYSSTHRSRDKAGDRVGWDERNFQAIAPLHTVIRPGDKSTEDRPVRLGARLNALGWLQVECIDAADAALRWPLEFNLHEEGNEESAAPRPVIEPGVSKEKQDAARARIESQFRAPFQRRDPISPTRMVQSLEKILGQPKNAWNAALLRLLWPALEGCLADRERSFEHEETWVSLAGLLLRPGYGVAFDEARIDQLWAFHDDGFWYPGKAMQLNADVLWRRVAGGLQAARQRILFDETFPRVRESSKKAPAEAVRLLGAMERIDRERKMELADLFLARLREAGVYREPYLVSLGRLLSRVPMYGGAESVLPAGLVEQAYLDLREHDWSTPEWSEAQTLFLRAARIVGDRALDVPGSVRGEIIVQLRKSGVPGPKLAPLENHVRIQQSDRASLFGESLPAGLLLEGAGPDFND